MALISERRLVRTENSRAISAGRPVIGSRARSTVCPGSDSSVRLP